MAHYLPPAYTFRPIWEDIAPEDQLLASPVPLRGQVITLTADESIEEGVNRAFPGQAVANLRYRFRILYNNGTIHHTDGIIPDLGGPLRHTASVLPEANSITVERPEAEVRADEIPLVPGMTEHAWPQNIAEYRVIEPIALNRLRIAERAAAGLQLAIHNTAVANYRTNHGQPPAAHIHRVRGVYGEPTLKNFLINFPDFPKEDKAAIKYVIENWEKLQSFLRGLTPQDIRDLFKATGVQAFDQEIPTTQTPLTILEEAHQRVYGATREESANQIFGVMLRSGKTLLQIAQDAQNMHVNYNQVRNQLYRGMTNTAHADRLREAVNLRPPAQNPWETFRQILIQIGTNLNIPQTAIGKCKTMEPKEYKTTQKQQKTQGARPKASRAPQRTYRPNYPPLVATGERPEPAPAAPAPRYQGVSPNYQGRNPIINYSPLRRLAEGPQQRIEPRTVSTDRPAPRTPPRGDVQQNRYNLRPRNDQGTARTSGPPRAQAQGEIQQTRVVKAIFLHRSPTTQQLKDNEDPQFPHVQGKLQGKNHSEMRLNALIDTGADMSLIDEKTSRSMKYPLLDTRKYQGIGSQVTEAPTTEITYRMGSGKIIKTIAIITPDLINSGEKLVLGWDAIQKYDLLAPREDKRGEDREKILEKIQDPTIRAATKRLIEVHWNLWQIDTNHCGKLLIEPGPSGMGPFKITHKYGITKPEVKREIQKTIDRLEEQGVLITAGSPYNTSIMGVPKPGRMNQYRLVCDYRALNKNSTPFAGHFRGCQSTLSTIKRCKYKTTFDLSNGFWSHPLRPEEWQYTAITDTYGVQKQFTRLPQGYHNSPVIFSAEVRRTLEGVTKPGHIECYVDDIYITHDDLDEHFTVLHKVCEELLHSGYIVGLSKSQIAQQEVEYLGVRLTSTGKGLTDTYKEKIQNIKTPTKIKELQAVLGLLNYCREFVPGYAGLTKELYSKLTEKEFLWTSNDQDNLEKVIREINQATDLGKHTPGADIELQVILGEKTATIRAKDKGETTPFNHFTMNFSNTEIKYPKTEKVLVAVTYALGSIRKIQEQGKIIVLSESPDLNTENEKIYRNQKVHSARYTKWDILYGDPTIQWKTITPQENTWWTPPYSPAKEYEHSLDWEPIITIYTDGSCQDGLTKDGKKEKQTGIGIVTGTFKNNKFQVQKTISRQGPSGGSAQKTEVDALKTGLEEASLYPEEYKIEICTDSYYASSGYNENLNNWAAKGFNDNKNQPIKYRQYWEKIAQLKANLPNLKVIHVRGHQKEGKHSKGNEEADRAAKAGCSQVTQVRVLTRLQKAEKQDEELEQVLQGKALGYPKNQTYWEEENGTVKTHLPTQTKDQGKIIPPVKTRKELIKLAHEGIGAIHPGIKTTQAHLKMKYWWPQLNSQTKAHCLNCKTCQQFNKKAGVKREPYVVKPTIKIPGQEWQIDFVGPLPKSKGSNTFKRNNEYCLVIVDVCTGFTNLTPTKSCTATDAIEACQLTVASAGPPKLIHSDQGPAFKSQVFNSWCDNLGIRQEFSTPYHPGSAGKVERKNQECKAALAKILSVRGGSWVQWLMEVQLAINNTPIDKVGPRNHITPHYLKYGVQMNTAFSPETPQNIKLRNEWIETLAQETEKEREDRQVKIERINFWQPKIGDWMQERKENKKGKAFKPRYQLPKQITEVGTRTITYKDSKGEDRTISVDNCRPCQVGK